MKLNIDFTNVEEGFSLPSEGDHICIVKSASLEEGAKAKYIKWGLTIGIGPDKGSKIFHITSLSPAALFNLRNTLVACGQNVPKSSFQVNTDLCMNKVVGVTLVHQEYEKDGEKKKSAKVSEIYAVVKTDKGYVRAEKQATEALADGPSDSTPPFNMDDEDEMDI